MSPGNLSRIENAEQGPPGDEVIVRLASALDADPHALLAIAGRRLQTDEFEEAVLAELKALRSDLTAGFARIEAALAQRP